MSALLFYKLNDDDVFAFYDLKKNNKELFKKKFHGYVLGRKVEKRDGWRNDGRLMHKEDDNKSDTKICDFIEYGVLFDTNEIYMKYTRTNDKMATVKANEKIKTFNNQRIYKHVVPKPADGLGNPDFAYVLKVLQTDPDLRQFI